MPKKTTAKPKKKISSKKKSPVIKKTKTAAKKTRAVAKPKTVKKAKKKKTTKLSPRDKKIQDIKKKLMAQKQALLLGAMDALNELPGQTVFPDLGDQATAEIDMNFMLRLKGRERKLLKKIDDAIERINQNVFGICERCGLDIDVRRLEARPVTTMCIDCKTIQEEEEKLREP